MALRETRARFPLTPLGNASFFWHLVSNSYVSWQLWDLFAFTEPNVAILCGNQNQFWTRRTDQAIDSTCEALLKTLPICYMASLYIHELFKFYLVQRGTYFIWLYVSSWEQYWSKAHNRNIGSFYLEQNMENSSGTPSIPICPLSTLSYDHFGQSIFFYLCLVPATSRHLIKHIATDIRSH